MSEIWVLGATGRIGRAVTSRLRDRCQAVAVVGRDAGRLRAVAGGSARVVTAGSAEAVAAEITRQRPTVVVNTIGDYANTAVPIARAGMPGGHYVDLADDLVALPRLFALHEEAAAAGSTLVTAAGFGALATEAVVVALCAGRARPSRVHVDALSSVAVEAGVVGAAYATSIVDVLTSGGRRIEDGHLVETRLGADPRHLALPDGQTARAAALPAGELLVAHRASGAPTVTAASSLVPTGPLARAVLPVAARALSVPALRRLAIRGLGRVTVGARPRPRQHSWGHAVVEWPDGTRREGWLRAADGMGFTVDAATEVAVRLAAGGGRPGAATPAVTFGPEVAVAAGAHLLLDQVGA
jgi:short subunit dehydrogenase-like uncharacterized protein